MTGIGAAYSVLAAETTLLWILERAHVVPAATVALQPAYLAAGAAGGISASAGGWPGVFALCLYYVAERSIRFALQLQGLVVTRDVAVLDPMLPEATLLVGATAAVVALSRSLRYRPTPSDVLVIAGACFVGATVALLPSRARAMDISGMPGPSIAAMVGALAIMSGVATALLAWRSRITFSSQLIGVLVIAVSTGVVPVSEWAEGTINEFTIADGAPLICAATAALTAIGTRAVQLSRREP